MSKKDWFLVLLVMIGVISVGASFWIFQPGVPKTQVLALSPAKVSLSTPTAIPVVKKEVFFSPTPALAREVTPTQTPTLESTPSPTPTAIPVVKVANPRQESGDFQAGMAVVIYGNDQEFEVKTRKLLDRLTRLEVNSLCLVFPLFQDNWTSSTVWVDEKRTPSEERIRLFVRESHKRGFTVMLRPILDEASLMPDGQWRGSIKPQDKKAWFESYTEVILGNAKLAEEEGVEILNIGTELSSLEKETNRWLKLIEAVRFVYHGQLTYSSNWGVSYNVKFWDKLDFISVDAFFELDAPQQATVEQLIAAWQPWIMQMNRARAPFNKPLVFTELGTRSQTGSHQKPWLWEHNTPVNLEAQRIYYAAACQASLNLVDGIYWWSVGLDPPSNPKEDPGFNPLGKPAETEIRRCFEMAVATSSPTVTATPTPSPTREERKEVYYEVKEGDWLFKIAQSFYGDWRQWPVIYEANRGIIQKPNLIYPGQVLVIPK